jgi:peptidoglycan-associated lipoprotein
LVHFNKCSTILRYSLITAILVGMPFLGACSHQKVKDDSAIAGDTQLNAAINDSSSSDLGNAYGLKTIHFGFDSSLLGKEAKLALNDDADILKKNPVLHVQIEGHCDRMGGIQYNLALGQRRADGVKHYLVDRGVRESQLTTISYGKEKPLDTAQTEEADAKNRRANLVVTKGMI